MANKSQLGSNQQELCCVLYCCVKIAIAMFAQAKSYHSHQDNLTCFACRPSWENGNCNYRSHIAGCVSITLLRRSLLKKVEHEPDPSRNLTKNYF